MHLHPLHSWDLTSSEAIALQRRLADRIEARPRLRRRPRLIAGADISHNRFSNTLYAGVVVLETRAWSVVEQQGAVMEVGFPYRTGLLTFREAPPLLAAFAKVQSEPDVVVIDGQGVAHPRRCGLAAHIGLWLDRPCLGCAKTRLTGVCSDLGRQAGATARLTDRGEVIGTVVRTKTGVAPVYVSVGNKISLASAVEVVLASARGYRIPEPTRQAHLYVNDLRRQGSRGGGPP